MSNASIWERLAVQKAVFDQFGSLAEIEMMPEPQRTQYEQSLKVYRDTLSILKTERAEERDKIARNLKKIGVDYESIAKGTGLTIDEIARL